MTGTRLEAVLRRDRAIVLTALAALAGLAWLSILWFGASMGAPGDAAMAGMTEPAQWSAADAAIMLSMWSAMMVGMMTPSAAPMILIYARVGRQAAGAGKPFAAAGWFASGYLLAWIAFAAAATGLQWLLEQAMLLTPMMEASTRWFGGLLLVAAGLYQFTPLKDACLSQCRSPFLFIQQHGGFRSSRSGAAALGLRHGAYCIGCCWGLMLLLFFGGVMNVLWIAAIAVLALAEKALPAGRLIARATGLFLAAGGVVVVSGAV